MARNFDFVDLVVFVDFAVFVDLAIFAESVVFDKSMDSAFFIERLILTSLFCILTAHFTAKLIVVHELVRLIEKRAECTVLVIG